MSTSLPTQSDRPQTQPGRVQDDTFARIEEMLDSTELAIAVAAEREELAEQEALAEPVDAPRMPGSKALKPAATGLKVSVVMPVFNERKTIWRIVERVRATPLNIDLIIVDDASTDGTSELLCELENERNVQVHWHGHNQGKGAALRTGLRYADGDIVLIQDADLEYNPADYASLVAPLVEGRADVVYGSRYLGGELRDSSPLHRLGNWLLTAASNLATGQRLTDMETCYKVFRRAALEGITIRENRFGFEPEITAKLAKRGRRIVEVPIAYQARAFAEGKKIGVRDAIRALWCIARYRVAD